MACKFIKSAGYVVFAAKDGAEALEIARRLEEPIHLLITDVVMPKMWGPELARRLEHLQPGLRIVYMPGYLEYNGNTGDF